MTWIFDLSATFGETKKMGKTKKFIEKGSKFFVVHRSQQDAEYGKDGASALVLVPADAPGLSSRVDQVIASKKDHINSLGFANDGYDYDQHFREIGKAKII